MSYNGTDLSPDPLFLQTGSYDAKSDRKTTGDEISAGVVGGGDYLVTYSGGTLVLNVAAGVAYIKGGNVADQGSYRQYISTSTTVTCPVADPSNPRIDTIILRAFDNAADGSALNKGRVECVPGTPTVGATLGNLNGKNSLASLTDLSLSFIVLAYVLVPAGAAALTSTAVNVSDRRTVARLGGSSLLPTGIFTSGAGTQAFNTTNESTLLNGGVTVPSNIAFRKYNKFIVEGWGFVTVKPSSVQTLRFRGYRNAALLIDSGVVTPWASTASPQQVPLHLKMSFTTMNGPRDNFQNPSVYLESLGIEVELGDTTGTAISSGLSGTIKPSIPYRWYTNGSGPSATQLSSLDFTAQWGAVDVNNTIAIDFWHAYIQ